ncbi:DUF4956 domain-containing protein [Eubacteriales bacterium OttesenSCG-928-G02]|nr:DUF4956 domain-containing protein [Eubacteriales bacterium OttesenSCG-928-G02]
MNNFLFGSIFNLYGLGTQFILCTAASLILGIIAAATFMFKNKYSKGFVVSLVSLPLIVQVVILLVNGNLGAGIAVAGAFSLVRFRSVPGTAREISSIFLVMAIGFANGMGYIGIAVMTTIIICIINIIFALIKFGDYNKNERLLKITIPENLDYTTVFDDIFKACTKKAELEKVKTTNMGSLFVLDYKVILNDNINEKEFIDALRCKNGNLNIICSRVLIEPETL